MQIYPTKEQEKQLFKWCKDSQDAWNYLVAKYKDNLPKAGKQGIAGYTSKELRVDLNLFDTPERLCKAVLIKFGVAVKAFYNHVRCRPRFHKYNPNKQSFHLSIEWDLHTNKNGELYFYFPTVGKGTKNKKNVIILNDDVFTKYNAKFIREPSFIFDRGKWFLSGCIVIPDVDKSKSKEMLGLDWGLKNFMTTSNGDFINYPKSIERERLRIKKLKKILSNKKYKSKNYCKIENKISKAYRRYNGLKRNFIEQTTTKLARTYNISIESLANFVKEEYSQGKFKNSRPYYVFIDKLRWKCEKFGSYFVEVKPYFTSQICCECGTVHQLSLKDRIMVCECGNIMDRDVNAAINICNRGIKNMSLNDCLSQS